MNVAAAILEISNITVLPGGHRRWLRPTIPAVRAVGGVSFGIRVGDVDLVGESARQRSGDSASNARHRVKSGSMESGSAACRRKLRDSVGASSITFTGMPPLRWIPDGASAAPLRKACASTASDRPPNGGGGSTRCSTRSVSTR
jgi:hypothetical protein